MARFNKIPFAMVFPKITKITVKKDVLEASSQLLNTKTYERKKYLTREQQRELNEKYLYQNLPKIEKMYERLYRKKM